MCAIFSENFGLDDKISKDQSIFLKIFIWSTEIPGTIIPMIGLCNLWLTKLYLTLRDSVEIIVSVGQI